MARCNMVVEIKVRTGLEKHTYHESNTLRLSAGVAFFRNSFLIPLKWIRSIILWVTGISSNCFTQPFTMVGLYGCLRNKTLVSNRKNGVLCTEYVTLSSCEIVSVLLPCQYLYQANNPLLCTTTIFPCEDVSIFTTLKILSIYVKLI